MLPKFECCQSLNKQATKVAIFILSEQKKFTSLNLRGTYQGTPLIRPPSCTTSQQPIMYLGFQFSKAKLYVAEKTKKAELGEYRF